MASNEDVQSKFEEFIDWLLTLDDVQREEFIYKCRRNFCRECGSIFTGSFKVCYCNRDECF